MIKESYGKYTIKVFEFERREYPHVSENSKYLWQVIVGGFPQRHDFVATKEEGIEKARALVHTWLGTDILEDIRRLERSEKAFIKIKDVLSKS